MKTLIRNSTLTIALLVYSLALLAQSGNKYTISGNLIDGASAQPVAYTTAILKTDKNTVVKQILTRANGTFAFADVALGNYTITLICIGYQTQTIPVDLTITTNLTLDMGVIKMHTHITELSEVSVKADKPIIKQEIDRISYDLLADPESKVSNVLEMLRKVPFITIDGNENIMLRGNSNYKVFIDSKPSGMVERDPKNILRSIPASTIQRIEIITNPPAKYDAEGLAGIINIITNKISGTGYSGTINLNVRYPAGPGMGGSFNLKQGKLGIAAVGGGSFNSTPQTTLLNIRNTTIINANSLIQQGNTKTDSRNAYIGTDVSYEIDSLNLLSARFNMNGSTSNGIVFQNAQLKNRQSTNRAYNLNNTSNGKGYGFDATLNYQLGFKHNTARLLTFSYGYSGYSNQNTNELLFSSLNNYTAANTLQYNQGKSTEQTLQIDYVRGLTNWIVEAGVKGIHRINESDFRYRDIDALNNTSANAYNGVQDILAAYNSWQYSAKKWGIKAGLRIEQTFTDADYTAAYYNNVKQRYFNVVPSVGANLTLSKTSGLNFGFSQRLRRPGIARLNPFVDNSNPNFITTGNPELRRTLVNSAQLSYRTAKKANLTMALSYDFVSGVDLAVATLNNTTGVTTTTYKNVGKISAIGNSINLSYPLTRQITFTANTNAMYYMMNGVVEDKEQTSNIFTLSVSSSLAYALNNGWRITAGVDITGKNPTGLQGYSNGFTATNLSINKLVIKNKLAFSANVRNPFTQYRYNITTTNGNDFDQLRTDQIYFRSFTASLNYNFGKLKDTIKKNKRSINNDDVSR